MANIQKNDITKAPIVASLVAALTFFLLYYLAGLKDIGSDVAGINIGLLISVAFAGVVFAVLLGELLSRALGAK